MAGQIGSSVFEQFQGAVIESSALQQPQIPSTLPHQPYVIGDQFYSHYIQAQQQQPPPQQQQTNSSVSIRQNSVNSGVSGPPHQQQPFQPGGVSQSSSVPPNGQYWKLFSFNCFLYFQKSFFFFCLSSSN
ncbi:unnamed protein product [Onchocerca flexuosa]|uniref:Uncharacterized protein n=1 Tax=Onchocerca flexuosa TaxID=387005 RepID=A0A183HTZ6_9BILA|nr:unnamed protein product [Onchocerca flexuosa]